MKILEQQYHDELKKELQGAAYAPKDFNVNEQSSTGEIKTGEESTVTIKQNVEDRANMPLVTMSCKKRKLWEAMQICNEQKQAANDLIKQRKKILEEAQR